MTGTDGVMIDFALSNAAPEWQAGSLRWRSREMTVVCPLEGLVSS